MRSYHIKMYYCFNNELGFCLFNFLGSLVFLKCIHIFFKLPLVFDVKIKFYIWRKLVHKQKRKFQKSRMCKPHVIFYDFSL